MKKVRVATWMLGGFVALHLLGLVIAQPVTLLTYRALDHIGLDDELPALAMPISTALFWPFEKPAMKQLFEITIEQSAEANDLCAFAIGSALARRLGPREAEEVFFSAARKLQSGPCEGKFLVASLLPLAARAGLLPKDAVVKTVWDAYNLVGRGRGIDEDRCGIYTKALDASLSGDRPIRFDPPGAGQGRVLDPLPNGGYAK